MIKLYDKKVASAVNIEVGKTYFKSPIFQLLKITIVSHVGSIVTATIGTDTLVQTLTEAEALAYINTHGGYDDTK